MIGVPEYYPKCKGCDNDVDESDDKDDDVECQKWALGFYVIVFDCFMYIFTILINLYTLKLFNKSRSIFNVSYLILVSLLAVNYRTISMVRGEPYILFFLFPHLNQII